MAGDVVDLITQDHRELERLVGELSRHPDKRPRLTAALVTLLTAHCRAEEAEVYPVANNGHAARRRAEFAQAERLLAQLAEQDPGSAGYDEVLAELAEPVSRHVRDVESTVLPGIQERLDEQGRAELGVAFLDSRGKHLTSQPATYRLP
jgi:hemerythrin superfamily protein